MKIVYSKNNVLIRLTDERWSHIIENHDELAGRVDDALNTVAEPDIPILCWFATHRVVKAVLDGYILSKFICERYIIVKGIKQELLAAKKVNKKWIVVVYKEKNKTDGFIITAFITSRINYLLKKEIKWKKQS